MVGVHSVRRRGQIYLARVCFLLFRGWEFVVFVCVFCCFVVVNVYAGTINRRIRWVFLVYTVGIGLLCYIEYFAKCVADNYEMCCVHSTNGWCTFR